MVCLFTAMILSLNKWQYRRDVLSCVCVFAFDGLVK